MNQAGMLVGQEILQVLKKPLGDIIRYDQIERSKILNPSTPSQKLITVGDTTTVKLLSLGIIPDLSVTDGLERRQISTTSIESLNSMIYALSGSEVVQLACRNEAGSISSEAVSTLRRALACHSPVILRVRGEEDLITLPLIAYAPIGSRILYGQPAEGIVDVRVNKKTRQKAKRLMRRIGFDLQGE
jgi:GTP-dependent dephospho-CoA kinase